MRQARRQLKKQDGSAAPQRPLHGQRQRKRHGQVGGASRRAPAETEAIVSRGRAADANSAAGSTDGGRVPQGALVPHGAKTERQVPHGAGRTGVQPGREGDVSAQAGAATAGMQVAAAGVGIGNEGRTNQRGELMTAS